jgi:hypothetical protein
VHCSLFKFALLPNSVFLWVFEFLLGTSTTCHCLPLRKTALPLDTLQLPVLFVGMVTCLVANLFLLIVSYNGVFVMITNMNLFDINVGIYSYTLIAAQWLA